MSDVSFVRTDMVPEREPPLAQSGAVKWMRENLFSNVTNSVLTLLALYFLYSLVASTLPWIFHSSFAAESLGECRDAIKATWGDDVRGACWAVIRERWHQLVFGFYPSELYWRPTLAFALMLVALSPVLFDNVPRKLLMFTAIYPFLAFWLLWGGSIWLPVTVMLGLALFIYAVQAVSNQKGLLLGVVAALVVMLFWFFNPINMVLSIFDAFFGLFAAEGQDYAMDLSIAIGGGTYDIRNLLPLQGLVQSILDSILNISLEPVESARFGGFMLSVTIGITGISLSLPLGILLALGRQSNLLIVRSICIGFIEFIRGVPLITLLFVASTLLNYFLPPGTTFDIILRVMIMVTLFASAYMAEVIRGGLAALPKGQYEAADALGLDYWQSMRLIIMPQALKIAIPSIVSNFIGLFKDTTLVSIIGLLDPIGLSNAIRADQAWNGIVWELYGFIALMFWIFCFSMSRYSMYLERKLQTGHR